MLEKQIKYKCFCAPGLTECFAEYENDLNKMLKFLQSGHLRLYSVPSAIVSDAVCLLLHLTLYVWMFRCVQVSDYVIKNRLYI